MKIYNIYILQYDKKGSKEMVYLNHAATTYPKPDVVKDSVMRTIGEPPQAQYRSASVSASYQDVLKECRSGLAQLFHISDPNRIFFTSGSTQALNTAILGFVTTRRRIVITATEHNAVLRTIMDGFQEEIRDGRIEVVVVPCDDSGYVDTKQMEQAITEDTGLVVVNHCSNVTGAVQDVKQIGIWAAQAGAIFLLDASQSAGALPIDVQDLQVDMLAFTAHKGLYGIQGCGGLYVREGVDLRPLMYGGTGTDSRIMIPETPFYEVGTANLPGIAALNAGVKWILDLGIKRIMEKETRLMSLLYNGLKDCPGVNVYASQQPEGTVLSFRINGLSPADTGYILAGTYQIIVRTGLHCAPYIHKYLGTEELGTVRVSISYLTREEEVSFFLKAIRELTAELTTNIKV